VKGLSGTQQGQLLPNSHLPAFIYRFTAYRSRQHTQLRRMSTCPQNVLYSSDCTAKIQGRTTWISVAPLTGKRASSGNFKLTPLAQRACVSARGQLATLTGCSTDVRAAEQQMNGCLEEPALRLFDRYSLANALRHHRLPPNTHLPTLCGTDRQQTARIHNMM
jgi:hypothetical protein